MRKILTLFTALLLLGSWNVIHAGNFLAGTMNVWSTSANEMTKVGASNIYSTTLHLSATDHEFKVVENGSWLGIGNALNDLSNVSLSGTDNIKFTLSSESDVTFYFNSDTKKIYVRTGALEYHTFTSGSKIYYDAHEYGSGINIYNAAWKSDVSSVIEVDLSSDWTVTYGVNMFKSAASSWNFVPCSSIPSSGQNMIVSTDGETYSWDTYVPPVTPSVSFTSLGSTIAVNQDVKFSATSENINGAGNPASSYKFYVNNVEVSGEHYQFDAIGNYTIKVEAYDSSNDKQAEAEQNVEVISGAHVIYFVKNNAWPRVHAHMWDEAVEHMTTWPGIEMTLTNAETDRNHYAVYAVAFTINYDHIIFDNNGETQTVNLDLDFDKPYYFDGEWFATMAECDQPVLTTNFYLAGSFNGWSATANRFMKATEDATEASVTITIDEYSDITLKVIDNGAWCGGSDAITKDATSATIAAAGEGGNISMTPYAAGDYIFTLNLSTRVLTVTYPAGEAMPVPANIFLSSLELNNWAAADPAYKFAVSGDIATLEVNLAEDSTDYSFKLVYNGSWYGANYNFNYYWNTDVQMVYEETQATLSSFKAGVHTFTYNISTGLLTISFPHTTATSITIGSHEYATLYSATGYDVPNAVEAYMITGNSGTSLTLERIYNIPANTGVLLHAPAGSYDDFYEGDSRHMGVNTQGNKLKGTVAETVIADNDMVHYVLSYNDSGVGFFWPNGTGEKLGKGAFTNGAGKAYLELSSQSAGIIARRGFPLVAEQATGVDAVMNGEKAVKFIENGQLFILREGKLYNAQGLIVK